MDIVYDAFVGPLQYNFMVRALLVSVLVGVMCPVLGAYVVARGLGFMADALAHSVLPGMALAAIAGVSLFFGAIPVAIVIALLIGYLISRTGLSEDTAIGVLFAGLFALGLVILAASDNNTVGVEDALLGNPLGVSTVNVVITGSLAALVAVIMLAFHKEFVFANFDPLGAAVIGLPTQRLEYALLILLALVIVIALQAVGVVLVISMLITPAAAARLLTTSFVRSIFFGSAIGGSSAAAGLYISFHYNLAAGPAMALVATGMFALAAIYRRTTLPSRRSLRTES